MLTAIGSPLAMAVASAEAVRTDLKLAVSRTAAGLITSWRGQGERSQILRFVQPSLIGLIDGTISTANGGSTTLTGGVAMTLNGNSDIVMACDGSNLTISGFNNSVDVSDSTATVRSRGHTAQKDDSTAGRMGDICDALSWQHRGGFAPAAV